MWLASNNATRKPRFDFSNRTVVYVSVASQNSPAVILKTDQNIDELGWRSEELVSKKIEILMPEFLRADHEKVWTEFENKQSDSYMLLPMKSTNTFIRTREGALIDCTINVTLCTSWNNTLTYVCDVSYEQQRELIPKIILDS